MSYKADNELEVLELFFVDSIMCIGYKLSTHQGNFWKKDKSFDFENFEPIIRKEQSHIWLHNQYYIIYNAASMQYCNSNQVMLSYQVRHIAEHHLN